MLLGKTALVTGAAQGIGQAFAARLARDGASVAAVDLRPSEETVRLIEAGGGKAAAFTADLGDQAQVADLRAMVGGVLGDVDLLVNNAGIYPTVGFADLTMDLWREIFRVNVESMFSTTQAFLPAMKSHGRADRQRGVQLCAAQCS